MTHVPFKAQVLPLIRSGRKYATTRSRKLGEVGDVCSTDAGHIRLTRVELLPLGHVAETHYEAEGVESPEAFREVWREIHPRRGFRETDVRWYHEFVYLGGGGSVGRVPAPERDQIGTTQYQTDAPPTRRDG